MYPTDVDLETAHYAARSKLQPEDLRNGTLKMVDYTYKFLWYAEEHWLFLEEDEKALDREPTIGSDIIWKQTLAEAFRSFDLNIPTGLNDLPLSWANCIHSAMFNTFWWDYPSVKPEDVFGWKCVLRYGSFLHLEYGRSIPREGVYWPELGEFLVDFQMSLQAWRS